MSQESDFNVHPNARQISAFLERSLSPPERQNILGHIADCGRCRQIVHQAQDALLAFGVDKPEGRPSLSHSFPFFSRLTIWNFAWITGAAVVAAFLVVVFLHGRHVARAPYLAAIPAPHRSPSFQSPPVPDNGRIKNSGKTSPGTSSSERAIVTPPTSLQTSSAPIAKPIPPETEIAANHESNNAPDQAAPPSQTQKQMRGFGSPAQRTVDVPVNGTGNSDSANTPLQQKKRVAVLSFTTSVEAQHNASANGDIASDVAELLKQRFVQDKQFIVIEQSTIDKILKEQNFSNSDLTDPATAVGIGKLAGVDAVIIGSVSKFTLQKRGAGAGPALGRLHIPGAGIDSTTTNVAINITARMIDTDTGVLVKDVSGTGASNGTSTGASALEGQTYDPSGANFSNSLIGQATLKAIGAVASALETKGPPMAVRSAAESAYSGVVADVAGKTLILTIGTSAAVKIGDTVEILHPVKTVKNPETGEVLMVVTSEVGEARITEVDGDFATATYLGTGTVVVNDKVTRKP